MTPPSSASEPDLTSAGAAAAAPPREKPVRSRRGPRPPRPQAAASGRSSLLLGWILFLAVVGGLAAGVYFGREQVVALVPAAARFYQV
ncbi:MAG TPA: hypothetical protein VIK47_03375, partial [Kiloniellales bacterium]